LSLCPRTKKFRCPAVPLSWDKKVSLFAVPLSRDKTSRKNPRTIFFFFQIFSFFILFSLLSLGYPGIFRDGTGQAVKIPSWSVLWQNFKTLSCPTSLPRFRLAVPARPVPWQDFELVPLYLCPGTTKKLLSLCPEKLYCPVLSETLVGR
jgi:hypothetical protein